MPFNPVIIYPRSIDCWTQKTPSKNNHKLSFPRRREGGKYCWLNKNHNLLTEGPFVDDVKKLQSAKFLPDIEGGVQLVTLTIDGKRSIMKEVEQEISLQGCDGDAVQG